MKKAIVLISILTFFLATVAFAKSSFFKPKKVFLPKFKALKAREIEIVKKRKVSLVSKKSLSNFPFFNFPHFPFFFGKKAATGILGEEVKGNRYAIVIGISDYPGEGSDLNFADDDALLLAQVLKEKYHFPEENVFVFIDSEAQAEKIFETINDLRKKVTQDDEIVFFFSGHGVRGIAEDNDREMMDEGIVLWQGNDFFYLWDGQLKEWFENFPASRIVFIFDSCLSGGMKDLSEDGRIINMASWEFGRFGEAVELEELAHGEFTYYFVKEGMEEGKADTTPQDGVVSDEEAFDWAKENCRYDFPTIVDRFPYDLVF